MKQLWVIIIVCFVLALSGCAAKETKFDKSSIEKIKEGVTTQEEVINNLGTPDKTMVDVNGSITMQYKFIRAAAKSESFKHVGGNLNNRTDNQFQMVMIKIEPQGKVKYVFSAYTDAETNQVYGYSSPGKTNPLSEPEMNKKVK